MSQAQHATYTKIEVQHTTYHTIVLLSAKIRIGYKNDLAHGGQNYDVLLNYTRSEGNSLRCLQ